MVIGHKQSLFKRNLALLVPSFINKVGTIGLALIPILLVDLHFSPDASALTMTLIKSAGLIGIALGGILSDRYNLKKVILLSFGLCALSFGLLPWAKSIILVSALGMFANLGSYLFPSAAGLYLKKTFAMEEQQEAVGWMRTANNAGQILSFSVGWALAGIGTVGLFIFDSLTSLIALVSAFILLPNVYLNRDQLQESRIEFDLPQMVQKPGILWITALLAGCQVFFYELFMTSASAKLRIIKGDQGLAFFSKLMVINTILCALFAVFASRRLKQPAKILPLGLAFSAMGCLVSLQATDLNFYIGAFLITAGEIVYMSLSNFVLLQLLPKHSKAGTIYGFATMIQVFGKTLGGALAFPFVVYGTHPHYLIYAVLGISIGLFSIAIPEWKRVLSQPA